MQPTRVLILGAGRIGNAIAGFLSGTEEFAVAIADADDRVLSNHSFGGIETLKLDIADHQAAVRALRRFDAVLSALPHRRNRDAATAARSAGVHYFDLTEDVASTRHVQELALGAETAFLPQCGLAPGFVGIVGHDLAQGFDAVDELHLRVGALPRQTLNALQYSMTWSIEGVVNEYCAPCQAIRDGRSTELAALGDLETFELGGVRYEAFNTSGGLGTLCETLAGRVRELDYKSIRYPGHRDLMRILLQGEGRREIVLDCLRAALPQTADDVVVIHVTATGRRLGQRLVSTFSRVIGAKAFRGRRMSAIQLTTAAAACAVVDLFREGRLPQQGFLRQEDVRLADFLANRFGKAFAPEVTATGAPPVTEASACA